MTTVSTFLTHGALLYRSLMLATCAVFRNLADRRTDAARRETAYDSAAVRALADSFRKSDPGFASDLYAAADRHEREAAVSSR